MFEKFKNGELLVACDNVNKIYIFMEYLAANGFPIKEQDIESYMKLTKIPHDSFGIGFIRDMIKCGDVTDLQIIARFEIVSYDVFANFLNMRVINPIKKSIAVKYLGAI